MAMQSARVAGTENGGATGVGYQLCATVRPCQTTCQTTSNATSSDKANAAASSANDSNQEETSGLAYKSYFFN